MQRMLGAAIMNWDTKRYVYFASEKINIEFSDSKQWTSATESYRKHVRGIGYFAANENDLNVLRDVVSDVHKQEEGTRRRYQLKKYANIPIVDEFWTICEGKAKCYAKCGLRVREYYEYSEVKKILSKYGIKNVDVLLKRCMNNNVKIPEVDAVLMSTLEHPFVDTTLVENYLFAIV